MENASFPSSSRWRDVNAVMYDSFVTIQMKGNRKGNTWSWLMSGEVVFHQPNQRIRADSLYCNLFHEKLEIVVHLSTITCVFKQISSLVYMLCLLFFFTVLVSLKVRTLSQIPSIKMSLRLRRLYKSIRYYN